MIEIHELIIEARITDGADGMHATSRPGATLAPADEERLIERITRRVVARLREELREALRESLRDGSRGGL
ncbi:MAG: DUF5908 family protein [Janthinobacterium lividum]